jgi:hypothetical protein
MLKKDILRGHVRVHEHYVLEKHVRIEVVLLWVSNFELESLLTG